MVKAYQLWDQKNYGPEFLFHHTHLINLILNLEISSKLVAQHACGKKYFPIEGHDRQGRSLCHLIGEQEISIPDNTEFISYRPWLDMMITHVHTEQDPWYFEAEEIS